MGKKKSKKKKKHLFKNYKLFAFVGVLFHLIVYLLYDKTFYNDTLFWVSAGLCGLFFGAFFINKMNLLNPKSYRKIDGFKLKLYMSFICVIMIVGGIVIFGSVINGTILGLNYIGRNNSSNSVEYKIQKIEKDRVARKRKRRRLFRGYKPKVFFKREEDSTSIVLPERYKTDINYSDFRIIEMNLSNGLFGFEVIDSYKLKK